MKYTIKLTQKLVNLSLWRIIHKVPPFKHYIYLPLEITVLGLRKMRIVIGSSLIHVDEMLVRMPFSHGLIL